MKLLGISESQIKNQISSETVHKKVCFLNQYFNA
jgi:hypothetical protein